MKKQKTAHLFGSALLTVALLSGCSSIVDKAGEKVVEKGLEKGAETAGDVDVDIDAEDGGLSIDTDEGSLEIDGGKIPDGFPQEVPLPEGFEVTAAMALGSGDEQSFTVKMVGAGADFEATHEDLRTRAEAAGFEVGATTSVIGDASQSQTFTITNDDWDADIIVNREPQDVIVGYLIGRPSGS